MSDGVRIANAIGRSIDALSKYAEGMFASGTWNHNYMKGYKDGVEAARKVILNEVPPAIKSVESDIVRRSQKPDSKSPRALVEFLVRSLESNVRIKTQDIPRFRRLRDLIRNNIKSTR